MTALGGSITFKITDKGINIDEDTGELDRFEIFNVKNKERDKPSVTLEEAKGELENAIRDTGYIEKNIAIEGMTAIMDVSERTIQRARQSLGLETVRAGQGREHIALWVNPYVWKNPKDAISDYKERMAENDV